jgi:hypothetical protein
MSSESTWMATTSVEGLLRREHCSVHFRTKESAVLKVACTFLRNSASRRWTSVSLSLINLST